MPEILSAKYLPPTSSLDPFTSINRIFCPWFIRDRFNILNHYSPFKIANIQDEEGWRALRSTEPVKPIFDILDEQAQYYLSLNKPVYVSWSGGVDSTSVLVSFLKNGIKKDQLIVLASTSSKEEYPYMYNYLYKGGYNIIITDTLYDYYRDIKGIIVTGWCADQLFGSNVNLKDLSLYNLPWMDALKKLCNKENFYIKSYEEIEAVYKDYAEKLGFNITQWCEFLWMFNFGCKWSYTKDATKLSIVDPEVRANTYTFFDHYDFQRFAINNFDTLKNINVEINPRYYKKPLKEYIFKYTNDSSYLNNKNKQSSWSSIKLRNIFGVKDTNGYHFYNKSNTNSVLKMYLK